MRSLNDVDLDEVKDFLGKGWLTHDGMWFYHTYRQLGIQTANRLNREAIRALSVVEMDRAKKVLHVADEDLKSHEGLRSFILDSLKLILPRSVFSRARFVFPAENILRWEWENGECFAYKGMKQLGVIGDYVCGVIYRIECWMDYLGIDYKVNPKIEKCIMHSKGSCTGDFSFTIPA